MLSELSGVLLTGGFILAASTFVAANAPEKESTDDGDASVALQSFNNAYKSLASNNKKGDKLILAPSFGGSYTALESALAKAGILLSANAKDQHAIIDLQKLMKGSASFAAERKIQLALVEEGLLLLPGEALGLTQPGQFRITAPNLTSTEVASTIDKLYKVAAKFNVTLAKRPAAVVSSEDTPSHHSAEKEDDEESVVSNVQESSRKKRRS